MDFIYSKILAIIICEHLAFTYSDKDVALLSGEQQLEHVVDGATLCLRARWSCVLVRDPYPEVIG